MYSKVFNRLFDYYIKLNNDVCLTRQDVEVEQENKSVTKDTPTNEVTVVEPTEEFIVKKNIFGDLVARSKK